MKILIIKLGALGDVVRTLPILPAIKEKYQDSDIYWVTKPNAIQIFDGNPYVKKVFAMPFKTNESPFHRASELDSESPFHNPLHRVSQLNRTGASELDRYDILYNFDIDEEAIILADDIRADKKYGFHSSEGYPAAFNAGAEYYLNTLFDDELKRTNKKTYQEMMFQAAELEYKKQHCQIYLNEQDKKYAIEFINKNNIKTDKLIGIHVGASPRWPSKAWAEQKVKEFIIKAKARGHDIILFGGPDEIDKHSKLITDLKMNNIKVYQNNPRNSIKEFASLVNLCEVMVCSDTFALHIALSLKKPSIGLFFCTSPNEVEDYGLLKKIVSPLIYDFFPEKQDQYSEELVNSISAEEALDILN